MNYVLILILLVYSYTSYSQEYKIVKFTQTQDTLKNTDDINNIFTKGYNNTMWEIREINKTKELYSLKITSFNLTSGAFLHCDTISGLPLSFNIRDFSINNKYMLIVSSDRMILYEIGNLSKSIFLSPPDLHYANDSIQYSSSYILTDTTALLYTIYNYHPNDNLPGLHMKIFNLKTKKIVKEKYLPFSGVGISHISSNWLCVVKNRIYTFAPLTGRIKEFDFNLDELANKSIDIFKKIELDSNYLYEHELDSIIYNECNRIVTIKKNIDRDSLKYYRYKLASSIYSKDFISNTIKRTREQHSFIQNIFSIDDSIIGIALSQPGYNFEFRDLVLYDPLNDRIIKRINKFPISPLDSLTKPEDFYQVQINNSRNHFPYFTGKDVYITSIFPYLLYHNGTLDSVTQDMFKNVVKNGYIWSIIKLSSD